MTDIDPQAYLEVRFAGERMTVKVPGVPRSAALLQDRAASLLIGLLAAARAGLALAGHGLRLLSPATSKLPRKCARRSAG